MLTIKILHYLVRTPKAMGIMGIFLVYGECRVYIINHSPGLGFGVSVFGAFRGLRGLEKRLGVMALGLGDLGLEVGLGVRGLGDGL